MPKFARIYQNELFCTPEEAIKLNKIRIQHEKHITYHKEKDDFNPNKFKQKFKDRLSITKLEKQLNDKIKHLKYSIPKKLYDRITEVFKLELFNDFNSSDKRNKRSFQTKLDKALYLVLAIYNFNEPKNIYLQYLNKQYKENDIQPNLEKINSIKYKYDVEYRLSY